MTKRIFLGLIALGLMAGTITFNACKKDPESLVKNNGIKSMKSSALQEYEFYTPDAATIQEKLLLINNCVNEPENYIMPDMELKEAVWFLETYFNIGVCQKQKHNAKMYNLEKTYEIEVPIIDGWAVGDEYILKGQNLQTIYSDLLNTVVTEICPEYVIGFGDVYIQSITGTGVTLGLRICYGKQQKGNDFDEILMSYCIFKFPEIVKSATTMVYPADLLDPIPFILTSANPVSDIYMEGVLNQVRTDFIPIEIIGVGPKSKNPIPTMEDMISTASAYQSYGFPYKQLGHFVPDEIVPETTPLLDKNDYVTFGVAYRDYIYNIPSINIYSRNSIYWDQGHRPHWARCEYVVSQNPISNNYYIRHIFGIAEIAKYMPYDLWMQTMIYHTMALLVE